MLIGCNADDRRDEGAGPRPEPARGTDRSAEREEMVSTQIAARGVRDAAVLRALRRVPRERFVPDELAELAYIDRPLPIGEGQTISQPYIVGLMTAVLELDPQDRVLEVGTGSGYQAAILAELVRDVYTIEIVPSLGERAAELLADLGYVNVHARIGDGYRGWPEAGPFDAIIVTAAPDHVPGPLLAQLADRGRMVVPVGDEDQTLILLERTPAGIVRRAVLPVRFVPMTGEAEARGRSAR
ncbi:MAG: protein-L-isoaspartate(D-aspartate) O-methyltransferase [Planctomycetes bacterium]|nr:protein-L-isoaspartate(D-aspartate) O-methyltransferase [Planctomycetota bacterium]